MIRLLLKDDANLTLTSPCDEATFHRAKLYYIFLVSQVRFTEKSPTRSVSLLRI